MSGGLRLMPSHRPLNGQASATPDVLSPEHTASPKPSTTPRGLGISVFAQGHTALAPVAEHARLTSDSTLTTASESTSPWFSGSSSTSLTGSANMSIFSTKPTPPHAINVSSPTTRSYSDESGDFATTAHKIHPK